MSRQGTNGLAKIFMSLHAGKARSIQMLLSTECQTCMAMLMFLIAWELVGRSKTESGSWLPPASEVLNQVWINKQDLLSNAKSTLFNASAGYMIGNLSAFVLSIAFELMPDYFRASVRGFLSALFSFPLLVMVIIIGSNLEPRDTAVTLAALAVYYPTLEQMELGLSNGKGVLEELVYSFGGNSISLLRKIQIWVALPFLVTGLKTAVPSAMLGAMLGEFAGADQGLGKMLLGSMSGGNPNRIWSVSVVIALVPLMFFLLSGYLDSAVRRLVSLNSDLRTASTGFQASPGNEFKNLVIHYALPVLGGLFIWWALASTPLFKGRGFAPKDLCEFLYHMPDQTRSQLFQAFPPTMKLVALGTLLSLIAAFMLASVSTLLPILAKAILPVALLSQTVPIIAFVPILLLAFGRGTAVVIAVAISVTFFPSYVAIANGLRNVPEDLILLMETYGATSLETLITLRIRNSLSSLLVAFHFVMSRALMGVMIAEYSVTGTGLGALVYRYKGTSDTKGLWTMGVLIATVSVLISQILYLVQKRLTSRLEMSVQGGEALEG